MAEKYARRLDPATGDVVFDASRRSWAAGDPDTEIIVRCLRTPLGAAGRDMAYGLDLEGIDAGAANVAAVVRQRIEAALARYTTRGDFVVDAIDVDRAPDGYFAHVTHRRAGTSPGDATRTSTPLGR